MTKNKVSINNLVSTSFFILIVFYFSLIVIIGAIALYNQNYITLNYETHSIRKSISDKEIRDKAASLIKTNDPQNCDLVNEIIGGINYKTVCRNNIFYNLAQLNLDLNACDNLDDKLISIDECKKLVIGLIIKKEKSLVACEKVPENLKQSCDDAYWNFEAYDEKNPRLCERTSLDVNNSTCQNNILISLTSRGDSLNCSSFTDNLAKADCENYQKGGKSCDLIVNPLLRDFCPRKQ